MEQQVHDSENCIDPICGMTIKNKEQALLVLENNEEVYFCSEFCFIEYQLLMDGNLQAEREHIQSNYRD